MESGFCVWFPVLVFLSGTALGLLLYYFSFREQKPSNNRPSKEYELHDFLRQKAQESQLIAEENTILESRLNKINEQLNVIIKANKPKSKKTEDTHQKQQNQDLLEENKKLKKKVKKLKHRSEITTPSTDDSHLKDYKSFLETLEKAVKKAKKKTAKKLSSDSHSTKTKDDSAASDADPDFQPGNMDKYNFFKEKFSKMAAQSNLTADEFLNDKEQEESKPTLTDLYGITPEIQGILAQHDIFNFDDLSKTSISELKHILVQAGDQFNSVNPLNWPLQARLAAKGHWDVIKEYKKKMIDNH